MAKEENHIIQSVDRALTLLDSMAADPSSDGKSLNELTSVLGIDRSSVFRLLATLGKHGLVRQIESGKLYKLGYGIYNLAGALRIQEKITDIARPFLKELVSRIGENAHLAVRNRSFCIFIDREQANNTLSANTEIGSTEELYCTAVGKSLLCRSGRDEVEKLLSGEPLKKFTGNTITDMEEIFRELERVREQGYSVDNEEYENNVICLAGPVYGYEGNIEAAIGISGPKLRLEGKIEETGAVIRDCSARLSELLGYSRERSGSNE